ncbi:MAG: hypothetical protein IJ111_07150 [Eggerthellaceae bacterium]|nr:hypothetical protein [Eggerthellaceae bacterium]
MAVSDSRILDGALEIASTPGLEMEPNGLLEDTYLLAAAFPEEDEFMAACASTVRAIGNLVSRRVSSAQLKYALEGWSSYHYQHRVSQGGRADCRIVFRETPAGIEVMGFGHRAIPEDLYARMASGR